jgi:hypothetical protein
MRFASFRGLGAAPGGQVLELDIAVGHFTVRFS